MRGGLALPLGLAIVLGAAGCGTPSTVSHVSAWTMIDSTAHLRILASADDRLLIVLGPLGEGDTIGIYHTSSDATFERSFPTAVVLRVPLTHIAVTSTTHLPFITALGQASAVVGATHLDQVRDALILERIAQGAIVDLAAGDGIDRERLLTMKPDAVFAYPFGRGEGDVLQRSGIPVLEVCEYLEQDPLERAEWVKFFGVLLGKEEEAREVFAGIRTRYEAVRDSIRSQERPRVFFGSVWQGQWWVPGGDSYMARMIADAGGDYLFKDRPGSENVAVDMETILSLANSIDRWGIVLAKEGGVTRNDAIGADQRLASMPVIRYGSPHVFAANTIERDLFGAALLEPDQVLMDLCWIIRPDQIRPGGAPRCAYVCPVAEE